MRTTITRTGKLRVWSGTAGDLQRLLRHVESAFDDQRRAALQEADDHKVRLLAAGSSAATAESEADRKRTRVRESFMENAVISDVRTGLQRTGRLDEVLDAVTQKDVNYLSLTYPLTYNQPRRVILWFTRTGGLQVQVDADEQVWAESMLNRTLAETRRSTPWWAFLFAPAGGSLLGMVLYLSLFLVTTASTRGLDLSQVQRVLVASAVASPLALLVSSTPVLRRLLPRFEVLSDGARPTGTLRVLALAGLIASTVAGALASYLMA